MKKIFLLLIGFGFTYLSNSQTVDPVNLQHFYVGTYTDHGSEGIYRFGLDTNTGKLHSNGLAVLSENPSFLALTSDKKFLLAVRETKDEKNQSMGYVELFAVDESGNLSSVNKVASGGAHPCHVTVNEEGMVLASNYTGGSIALMRIDPSGELSEVLSVYQHKGSGPVVGRQETPHVHSAIFEPKGKRIFVADLGIDRVKVYTIDPTALVLKPFKYPEIKLAPGSGPRHMVIHPNGKLLYIANELGCSVIVVQLLNNGSYKVLETVSTLPADYKKSAAPADIHLSPDAKFLYVSNRGMNSIAIFAVDEKGSKIKLIGHEDTRGETPRNFTLTPDGTFLLVANQNTNNIVAFRRNSETGMLTFTDQINAYKPVCLLFSHTNQ
ncbi:MAG TPA: lactonase family protein [Prolixibacteraceae bacterium]